LTTARVRLRYGDSLAKCAAPSPPNAPPSVERKTSVFVVPSERALAAPDVIGAYERASSTSAAVPEALSFAPGPVPALSRCAMITIVRFDRPGETATRLTSSRDPRSGIVASKRSSRTLMPYGSSCSFSHAVAWRLPSDPGERSGCEVARSRASWVAVSPSKTGGSTGAGRGPGRATVKAVTRRGSATSSQVPR
jgi:hypothetical protein